MPSSNQSTGVQQSGSYIIPVETPLQNRIQPWKSIKKLQAKEPNWDNACAKRIVSETVRILDEFDNTK